RRGTQEQHQQAPDPAPVRSAGAVPLPRRKPPTLVSDHGRRVGDQDRNHPSADLGPTRAEMPSSAPGNGVHRRRTDAPRPTAGLVPAPPARADGLPRRVRQASLAPQLRENWEDTYPDRGRVPRPGAGVERDAEQVRNRMASMQRGWQRGRLKNADGDEDAARTNGAAPGQSAPRTTSEGDGR
ncbi:histidine kinase, partial [Streptomyces sp. NPDC055078]